MSGKTSGMGSQEGKEKERERSGIYNGRHKRQEL